MTPYPLILVSVSLLVVRHARSQQSPAWSCVQTVGFEVSDFDAAHTSNQHTRQRDQTAEDSRHTLCCASLPSRLPTRRPSHW